MEQLPQALAGLAAYQQFVVYKVVPGRKPGKMDKLPLNQLLQVASAHDPNNWLSFEAAAGIVKACGPDYGVGFVFTANDPFFFVDLDDCEHGGSWSPVSNDICHRLTGAAIEVSQSGKGLHIIGSGIAPDHGCKNPVFGLEFYTQERFVALTGRMLGEGSVLADVSAQLPQLVADYFPVGKAKLDQEWTTEALDGYGGPDNDAELIDLAMRSKSAASVFGGTSKASFADLWTKQVDLLANAYPDNFGNRQYDESSADAALAAHLAFWTGHNCDRMLRLMRQSGLARPKWEKHRSYLTTTIKNACANSEQFYTGRQQKENNEPAPVPVAPVLPFQQQPAPAPAPAPADGPQIPAPEDAAELEFREGYQYLAPTQQVEFFRGCVYIQDIHKALTPTGAILKPEQFRATYGGYVFALDSSNSKTTKSAWEVFTESQAVRFPKVQGTMFRPDRTPGELIDDEGRLCVNTYYPPKIDTAHGDITPFFTHLHKLLPDAHDREIVLAYMAACVQHQGIKFQWAPLIQGTEGNGKTLLSRCVAYAVGERFTHWPKAHDIANKFNAWMADKTFIGVEDIYVPEHKKEVIESLKPMITNNRLEIQLKGVDQKTMWVCANFMLNSNHKDAVRKTQDDRRFSVFYTAQQSFEDVRRDGMGGTYFPDLYNWLKGTGKYAGQPSGYAMVAQYLQDYAIPDELNPATSCHRAPETSSTEEAINASRGSIEQEILEAIDEGRPGFAGGWVSSAQLEKLLKDMRADRMIPPNKRRALMQSMGYDYHPGLPNGRTNNPIAFDGCKPRLYAKVGHLNNQLEGPAAIVSSYESAQLKQPDPAAVSAFGTVDGGVNKS